MTDLLGGVSPGVILRVTIAGFVVMVFAIVILSPQQLIAIVTVAAIVGVLLRDWWRSVG
jgi:hypothetical protein